MTKDEYSNRLFQIIDHAGLEILNDRRKFLSYLRDLAPEFKTENKVMDTMCDDKFFGFFVQETDKYNSFAGHPESIGNVQGTVRSTEGSKVENVSQDDIDTAGKRAAQYLVSECMIIPEVAQKICDSLADAIKRYISNQQSDKQMPTISESGESEKGTVSIENSTDQTIINDQLSGKEPASTQGIAGNHRPVDKTISAKPDGAMSAADSNGSNASDSINKNKDNGKQIEKKKKGTNTGRNIAAIVGVAATFLGVAAALIFILMAFTHSPYLEPTELAMGKGGERVLEVSDCPEDSEVTWVSSDPKIVSVDSDGTISAKKKGSAEVDAYVDGEYIGTCSVTVGKLKICREVDSDIAITNDGESPDDFVYPMEGEACTFFIEGTDSENIKWSSSDSSVIALDFQDRQLVSGTALKPGLTTIKAKVDGQTVKKRVGVWASEEDGVVFETNVSKIKIKDKGEIILTYNDDLGNISVECENGSVISGDFSGKWYADSTVFKIKKEQTGTATLIFTALDENGDPKELIDPVKVKVICK